MTTPALPLQLRWRGWPSRHVLLLAVALLVPAFLLTRWLVGTYHDMEHRLAADWYRKGESDLAAGRLAPAIDDYRAALSYARDNPGYRLRLAQALERAGRLDSASADLRRLWEDQPADSVVNLELARLSARRHDVVDAIRYYNNAIYGVWASDAAVRRRDTQLELIGYLLANGRNAEARSGLIALAADAPPDAALRVAIGTRMVRAGADRDALREFSEAMALDRRSPVAAAQAGAVAFGLGDFEGAERDLTRAERAGDRSPSTMRLLATARTVLSLDPFARGLRSDERVRRVRSAFEVALRGFGACATHLPPGGNAEEAAAGLRARLENIARLLRRSDARDAQVQQDAMEVVFDNEEFLAAHCGPLGTGDAALLALGRSRRRQP